MTLTGKSMFMAKPNSSHVPKEKRREATLVKDEDGKMLPMKEYRAKTEAFLAQVRAEKTAAYEAKVAAEKAAAEAAANPPAPPVIDPPTPPVIDPPTPPKGPNGTN